MRRHERKWQDLLTRRAEKNSEQDKQNRTEQNRTKTAEGSSIVYLVMFRQSNIVSVGILSLEIIKTNSLPYFSGSDSHVIKCFLMCEAIEIAVVFMVAKIFI